jgi:monoamine oxidase
LRDRGAYIELVSDTGCPLRARQVVLALPPRLVLERIQCDPALPDTVLDALTATPTWMASQAKSVTTFSASFWRTAGNSGSAFVRHPQAVLGEVFDVSASDHCGALAGFVALNAVQRENFQRGLPLLIASQLAQLFGQQAQDGTPYLQDWANEPWTCSTLDRANPPEPPQNDPVLRQPLWAGRIFLGGSEAAAHGSGHMEGALEAADRIAHAVCRPNGAVRNANQQNVLQPLRATDDQRPTRATALGKFSASVLTLRGMAPERYRLHLTRLLSGQQSEQLTQRALLATADQVYSETLTHLDPLLPALNAARADVVKGRHALTAALLAPFDGWNKGLLDAALSFNGTSCALSSFPQDHRPDPQTVRAITLDLAAAWREFALELNARVLTVAAGVETI